MGNSRWSGSLISGGGIFAAGTTLFKSSVHASAATNLGTAGVVAAEAGFQFMSPSSWYLPKQFSLGTYYGVGGATAPITATGLATINGIWMTRRRGNYAAGTVGAILCTPEIANGTPGSFYPLVYKTQAGGGIVINAAAATFSWLAVGNGVF
jgi:hypothetical protein